MNDASMMLMMPSSGGLFWNDFDAPKTSPVDEVLDKEFPDDLAKLDALLEEERLLQEIAGGHQRLVEFLKQPVILGRLIDNCTLGNVQNPKHVNVSHEVFASDCTPIMYFLVNDDALLSRVFQILDQPHPLNARLAGYFNSLLTLLAHRDAPRVLKMASGRLGVSSGGAMLQSAAATGGTHGKMLDSRKRTGGPEDALEPPAKFAANAHGLVPLFLRHIDSYSVASAMTALIHEAVKPGPGDDELDMQSRELWMGGLGAAQLVLSAMMLAEDQDIHNNSADVLSELLHSVARAPSTRDWAPSLINDAVTLVVSGPGYPTSLINALVRVLLQVVVAHTGSPAPGQEAVVSPELSSIVNRLPPLCVVLTTETNPGLLLDTQWGGHIKPLGMTRLLLAELLGSLIVSGLVSNQIVECEANPLGILVDLFFEYEWNNALHSVVERVIRAILTGERPRDESSVIDASKSGAAAHDEEAMLKRKLELRAWTKAALDPLTVVLLRDCRLADRVVQAYQASVAAREAAELREQGDLSVDKRTTLRKPNMGFLHRVANALQESGLCAEYLPWTDFATGELLRVNEKLAVRLGGGKPSLDRPGGMSLGMSASSPANAASLGRGGAYDDDDEDEDEEAEEENLMRKYGLGRDPSTGELVFIASAPSAEPPPPPPPPRDVYEEYEEDDDEEEEGDWIADFSVTPNRPPGITLTNSSSSNNNNDGDDADVWKESPIFQDQGSAAPPTIAFWDPPKNFEAVSSTDAPIPSMWDSPPSKASQAVLPGWEAFSSPQINTVTLAWDSSPEKWLDSPDSDAGKGEGKVVLGPGWDMLDLQSDSKQNKQPLPPKVEEVALSSSVGSSSGWVADFDDA